jgi:hypothetical protein
MTSIYNYFKILLVLICFTSCIQTRTLTTNNQKLNEFDRPDYIGTFSAIYYVDANKSISINPLQTYHSIYKNDSIIRKRVKQITFTNQQFDTLTSQKINKEIISTLNYVRDKEKIKGFATSGIFDEIGRKTKANFNVYFISTGFTKDTILARKETILKTLNTSLTVLSGFTFPLTGAFIYASVSEKNFRTKYSNSSGVLSSKELYTGKQGLRGFVIVYDKVKKEVCYVREQFFSFNKNPLKINAIKNQIKYAFKEIYF